MKDEEPPPHVAEKARNPEWPRSTVMIHGLADARFVLGLGQAVTLLSAPGAAVYAGVGWWRAVVVAARAEQPDAPFDDILDCGDAAGRAAEAIRAGQRRLILTTASSPLRLRVLALAEECGAVVWPEAPPALDLAVPGMRRRLEIASRLRDTEKIIP
jgi:hypothetical protein